MVQTMVAEKQKLDILKPFRQGDIVEGNVVGIGRSAVYLDLGPQGTGIIFGREFLEEKGSLKDVQEGETIMAKIIDLENEQGYIELSLKEAGREMTWDKLKEKKEKEEICKVKIVGANKGGLLAELSGMQAFLPVSQLSQEHYPRVEDGDSTKILRALQEFMGQEIDVQIFDLDQREEKIILSERSKERAKLKEQLAKFQVGDVVEGEITGVVDFGAFVKFPLDNSVEEPIEGLIHISEIDWQIIEDPNKLLTVGDKVKVKIVDLSAGRASLSLKALKEDPWQEMEKKYGKLDKVKGKVTKLNPFGAFIEVGEKIQGLCHISEFGTKAHMDEVLKAGEMYDFQILEINPVEHRMSLRLVTADAPVQTPPQTDEKDTAEKAESEQTEPQKEEKPE
jgi:small subunit ribosomal protein S1